MEDQECSKERLKCCLADLLLGLLFFLMQSFFMGTQILNQARERGEGGGLFYMRQSPGPATEIAPISERNE